MINFNKKDSVAEEVTKILAQEAELSHKQKRIAALAGDKKAIDALDLAALRAGKKPVDVEEGFGEMDKYLKDKEKEKGTGKYDKKKISTGTVYQKKHNAPKEDEKDDMKEEVEQIDELSKDTLSSYLKKRSQPGANPKGKPLNKSMVSAVTKYTKKANEEVELDEAKEKKPEYDKDKVVNAVQAAMLKSRGNVIAGRAERAAARLAAKVKHGMKEDVEQIDEISKETAGKYLTAPQGKGANKYKTGEGTSSYPNADTMLKHGKSVSRAVQRAGTGMSKKPSYYKEEEQIDETVSRKHFQQVADLIKSHENAEKRKELAQHHASIFKTQNPRFDHAKFMKAAGVNEGTWAEEADCVTTPQVKKIAKKEVKGHEKTMHHNEEVDTDVRTKDMLKGRRPTKQKDDVGPGSDGKSTKVRYHPGPHPSNEEVELDERTLTATETKKKEHMVMSMKPKLKDFKKRYGERAKEVMYATATKRAKGE